MAREWNEPKNARDRKRFAALDDELKDGVRDYADVLYAEGQASGDRRSPAQCWTEALDGAKRGVAVRDAIAKKWRAYVEAGYAEPKLMMTFDRIGSRGPAIVWECGPYEWAYSGLDEGWNSEIADARSEFPKLNPRVPGVETPKGVFVEPIYTYALAVYADN